MIELPTIAPPQKTRKPDWLRVKLPVGPEYANVRRLVDDNKLHKIFVEGNGQTIYYAKNKEQKFTGVNRADCSDIYISVEENKVKEISLVNKPDATFYPIHELSPKELRLKGFSWQPQLRPENREAIFK